MSCIKSFNGGLGSGKTLRMSALALEDYNKGWKVFANYDFKDENGNDTLEYKKINPLDLINGLFDDDLDNAVICMTEAYTFLDSRYSGSESSRYITYFILQTRKRRIRFYYDAQLIGSVDNRLRGVTNSIYQCHKLLKDRNKDHEEIDNILGFVYHVVNDDETEYYESLGIDDAQQFFNLYNTKDILLPEYLQPTISMDDLISIFNDSENRDTFVILLRNYNPYISYDKCRALYSLLKSNKITRVKDLLRI